MRMDQAYEAFRDYLAARSIDPQRFGADGAFDTVAAWYVDERATDVDVDEEGDLLLFEWYLEDDELGRSFRLSFIRALVDDRRVMGDDMRNLIVTLHFEPTKVAKKLKSGRQLCMGLDDLDEFRVDVKRSKPFEYARTLTPTRVEVELET